jgi:hypothetical protein
MPSLKDVPLLGLSSKGRAHAITHKILMAVRGFSSALVYHKDEYVIIMIKRNLLKAVVLQVSKLFFRCLGNEAISLHDLLLTFFVYIDRRESYSSSSSACGFFS